MKHNPPPIDLLAHATNPRTRRAHRRETFWQIVLPLLIGAVLAGAAVFALLNGNFGGVQNASQIATTFLIFPLFVIGLLFFVLVVVLIYVLGRTLHWIPTQTIRAQRLAERVSHEAVRGANLLAEPLLFFESWSKAISGLFKRHK